MLGRSLALRIANCWDRAVINEIAVKNIRYQRRCRGQSALSSKGRFRLLLSRVGRSLTLEVTKHKAKTGESASEQHWRSCRYGKDQFRSPRIADRLFTSRWKRLAFHASN